MQRMFFIAGFLLALALSACAEADDTACPDNYDSFTEYRLFFGRGGPDGEVVGEEDWSAFVADTVSTRFPDGLTVLDATGQWREPTGTIQHEDTKLLIMLVEPGNDATERINEISEAYEARFGQESVLRVVGTACTSFS